MELGRNKRGLCGKQKRSPAHSGRVPGCFTPKVLRWFYLPCYRLFGGGWKWEILVMFSLTVYYPFLKFPLSPQL